MEQQAHGATTRNRSFQADFPFRRLTPPCQAGGFAWSDSSTAAAASAYRPRKADKDGGPSMLRQAIIALSTQHAPTLSAGRPSSTAVPTIVAYSIDGPDFGDPGQIVSLYSKI